MIPLAEKQGRIWDIPQEAEMPPCTGTVAALIMENLLEISSGKKVTPFPATMKASEINILRYLSQWGFISDINVSRENEYPYVLERGVNLIATMRKKPLEEILKKVNLNIGINVTAAIPYAK